MPRLLAVVVALAFAATPSSSVAQDNASPHGSSDEQRTGSRRSRADTRWRPRLELENDAYNFWIHPAYRPDEEYTNGVRASLQSPTAPWWGRRFARGRAPCADLESKRDGCLLTTITLAQEIYTPRLDRAPFSSEDWEDERPYFGWLYLTADAQILGERLRRTTSLTLGVTGGPSLGHAMQGLFHTINDKYTREATGWETQIGFEPGVILAHRVDARAFRAGTTAGVALELLPSAGVSVGNVLTSADAGATVRTGIHLSHPWNPRSSLTRRPVEVFLTVGGRMEYVARNMSLDGNTVTPRRSVDRTPLVGEYAFGGGVRVSWLALEYRAVTRSREYRTGPGHHTYSTMAAELAAF